MQKRKPRILFVNEFSQLMTGFSTYMYYLLPRLYETGKYEIAEIAGYTNPLHPAINAVPWKVYPNEPHPEDKDAKQRFDNTRDAQFGKWVFDEACWDFKPDIIVNISDPWMCMWIGNAPYRKHFHWVQMPTVDGEPQKEEWLEHYEEIDTLLTYTHYGKNLLETQSGGNLKVSAVASPGSDLEIFSVPENKQEHKKSFNLDPESNIIMTVMRNQPRKLFPDLFKAFNLFLDRCKEEGRDDIANKTFLYCHTTYPDVGWDLAEELIKHNLSHKVLFTYMCDSCHAVYPSFYNGERHHCYNCGQNTARFPNTGHGVDRQTLAHIMKCADLYVQYSVSEGFGMPICDAKACGVPVMAVDGSAMMEQAHGPGGIPIKVQRFFQEPMNQTGQLRAFPNNQDCANKMFDFFTDPQKREKLSIEARKIVESVYNWEYVASVWENVLDNIELKRSTWYDPPNLIQPNTQIPNFPTNEQFVDFVYEEVLKEPDKKNSSFAKKIVASLNAGFEPGQDGMGRPTRIPISRETVLNNMFGHIQHNNRMEQYRFDLLNGQINNTPQLENQGVIL